MRYPTGRTQMISVLVAATLLGSPASRRSPRRCAPAAAAPSPRETTAPPLPVRAARPSRARTATPPPDARRGRQRRRGLCRGRPERQRGHRRRRRRPGRRGRPPRCGRRRRRRGGRRRTLWRRRGRRPLRELRRVEGGGGGRHRHRHRHDAGEAAGRRDDGRGVRIDLLLPRQRVLHAGDERRRRRRTRSSARRPARSSPRFPASCKSVRVGNASYMQCGPTYYTKVSNGYQVVVLN